MRQRVAEVARLQTFIVRAVVLALLSLISLSAAGPARAQTPLADVAARILDDQLESAERVRLIDEHLDQAAPLLAALVAELPRDDAEEYRRIPWIWRVSITAARRNQGPQLVELMRVALPAAEGELRDWQAVVIGGGLINGVSQQGVWPQTRFAELLAEDSMLRARWQAALRASLEMADDEHVRAGTRYDALRMVALLDWPRPQATLDKYLARGTHAELQMGAVSGYVDVDQPVATRQLVSSLAYLPSPNRELALEGLLRTEARALALLAAVEAGQVPRDILTAALREKLDRHESDRVRASARRVLGL